MTRTPCVLRAVSTALLSIVLASLFAMAVKGATPPHPSNGLFCGLAGLLGAALPIMGHEWIHQTAWTPRAFRITGWVMLVLAGGLIYFGAVTCPEQVTIGLQGLGCLAIILAGVFSGIGAAMLLLAAGLMMVSRMNKGHEET